MESSQKASDGVRRNTLCAEAVGQKLHNNQPIFRRSGPSATPTAARVARASPEPKVKLKSVPALLISMTNGNGPDRRAPRASPRLSPAGSRVEQEKPHDDTRRDARGRHDDLPRDARDDTCST